jgi:hypothetical protein
MKIAFENFSQLQKATRELLAKTNSSLLDLSVSAEVGYHWLQKFKAGKIASPNADAVQRLYETMSGKKLVQHTR